MAEKNNWRIPATILDDNYKIDVTAIAPMVEMTKGETFKETGKESKNSEYKNIIRSDELAEGMVIAVEDDKVTER